MLSACACACAAIGVQRVIARMAFVIHVLVCGPRACMRVGLLRVRVGVQAVYLWGCGRVDVQPVFAGCGVWPRLSAHADRAARGRRRPSRGPGPAVREGCGPLPPRTVPGGGAVPPCVPMPGVGSCPPGDTPAAGAARGTQFPGRPGGSVRGAHGGELEPLLLRALRGNRTPPVSGALISGPGTACRFDEPCSLLEGGDEGGPRTSFLPGWQSHRGCQDRAGRAGAAGVAEQG